MSRHGKTAVDWARMNNHHELADKLAFKQSVVDAQGKLFVAINCSDYKGVRKMLASGSARRFEPNYLNVLQSEYDSYCAKLEKWDRMVCGMKAQLCVDVPRNRKMWKRFEYRKNSALKYANRAAELEANRKALMAKVGDEAAMCTQELELLPGSALAGVRGIVKPERWMVTLLRGCCVLKEVEPAYKRDKHDPNVQALDWWAMAQDLLHRPSIVIQLAYIEREEIPAEAVDDVHDTVLPLLTKQMAAKEGSHDVMDNNPLLKALHRWLHAIVAWVLAKREYETWSVVV